MTDDATTKAPEAQKKGASVAAGVEEETASPYPVMRLAQDMHRLCVAHSTIASNNTPSSSSVDYSTLEAKVWNEIISELENPSLYTLLRDKLYPFLAGEDVDDSKMTNTTTTTPPSVPSSSFVSLTPAQLQAMYDKNAATMLELQAAVARAMESAGDMEVLDARMAIARLAAKSLTCEQALEAYETLLSPPLLLKTNAIPAAAGTMGTTTKNKSISNTSKLTSGKKIDAYMAAARVTCFYKSFDPTPTMQSTDISTPTPASITGASTPDEAAAPSTSYTTTTRTTTEYLEKAYKLAQAGGGADWDRRNRLKVYRAVMQMIHLDRTIAPAAALLADCIATFNATECCTYTEFITYAILTNLLFLGRRNLKAQLLDGPEILSVSSEIPQVVRCKNSVKKSIGDLFSG